MPAVLLVRLVLDIQRDVLGALSTGRLVSWSIEATSKPLEYHRLLLERRCVMLVDREQPLQVCVQAPHQLTKVCD